MSKIKENKELESLNALVAEQIKGGNQSSFSSVNAEFTCIYDRKTHKQETWDDDSNGNPISRKSLY